MISVLSLSWVSFLRNLVSEVRRYSFLIINYAWMNFLLCVANIWWTGMPATVFLLGHPYVIPASLLKSLCVWLLVFPAFFLVYIVYQIETAVTKKMNFDAGAGWVDKETSNPALAAHLHYGPLPIGCAHACVPIKGAQIEEHGFDQETDAGQEFKEHEVCPNGGFLKWGYPQIIHFNRIFHEINHPFGLPPFTETSKRLT